MAKSPLTVTVITDTHYYAKSNGVEGAAYDAANTKSQLLLKDAAELLDAAFRQIKADKRTDIVLLSATRLPTATMIPTRNLLKCFAT